MALKKLNDTRLPQMYSKGLYSERSYDLPKEHVDKVMEVMIVGVTNCLNEMKDINSPIVMQFVDGAQFVGAAIVQYFPNEDDPSQPGNWNYSWTFEKEDLPDNPNTRFLDPYNAQLSSYFRGVGMSKYGMTFESVTSMGDVFVYLMKCMKQYLETSVSTAVQAGSDMTDIGFELEGIVQCRGTVEDDKPFCSIELDGEIKQLIKDDAAIETDAA